MVQGWNEKQKWRHRWGRKGKCRQRLTKQQHWASSNMKWSAGPRWHWGNAQRHGKIRPARWICICVACGGRGHPIYILNEPGAGPRLSYPLLRGNKQMIFCCFCKLSLKKKKSNANQTSCRKGEIEHNHRKQNVLQDRKSADKPTWSPERLGLCVNKAGR